MEERSNERFTRVFEEVILPTVDSVMNEDYSKIKMTEGRELMMEFIEFREAFQQRLKLFYFRQFLEYKKRGEEKIFPGDTEHLEKDVYFMYVEFRDFLKDQREKSGMGMGLFGVL
jgi:hypothetical protein